MTWPPDPDAPTDEHVRAFLDDVSDHPEDVAVRLVFADWLAERDDPRAELLRLQAEHLRGTERKEVEPRVRAWLEKHGRDWLGELPPPSSGYSLCLDYDLLEVMGYLADVFLHKPELRGVRHALGEGWIRFFRLTFWSDRQIEAASGLGMLSGPGELNLLGGSFTDATLVHLGKATQLRGLDVGGSGATVTDAGLAPLAALQGLRELSLWSLQRLTGAGLEQLTGLRALRSLALYNCENVCDDALAHVAPFPHLEALHLGKCLRVTDAGLSRLAGLGGLRELDLYDCERVTDAGLAHLSALTNLEKLNLASCSGITDAGLGSLAAMGRLRELNLYRCEQLTGAGFARLHSSKSLRWLNLRGCKLKPHETRALRKALPECEVLRK
jgi:uncharacterized protein (TIGR02996 family)